MPKCTYIDGIASSQALDTAGEIVDLKGLDTSSLIGAAVNWEHKKDVPAQIVGKILAVKKIFSEADCDNDRQLYYWEKIKIPFLYVMARLFDDQKPSAMEVAALFRDDAAHPNEPDMLGFSVEGSKIEKQGAVISRSIARLVTLANMPANKTCISEIIPENKKEKREDDISELFKGEMKLFQFEPTYVEMINKKEKIEKDAGMSIGAEVGAMAMAEGWSKPEAYDTNVIFRHKKHGNIKISKMPYGNFEIHHNDKLIGVSPDINKANSYAEKYMSQISNKDEKMEKALTAGSINTAPGQLVGGAVLSKESLNKKSEKVSMAKKEKSKWFLRADEAYKTWDKRPKFQEYMKKRMPHLTSGEIDAFGRCLALKKTLSAEEKLSKMYADSYRNENNKE